MNTIWKVVEMMRGAMSPSDAADLIIAEIGRQAGIDEIDLIPLARPEIEKVRVGSSYPVIQAAVAQIVAAPHENLLRELAESERNFEQPTFAFNERLDDFRWDATRIRVAFDAGQWLALLLAARLSDTPGGSVCFEAIGSTTATRAMVLARSLGLPLEVKRSSGYFANAPEAFDLTYLLPPIGYRMKEVDTVHDALDAPTAGSGRATAETLALGELLSSIPGRAVLLTGPGLAWRPAGVERQLRQDLVKSGRLAAAIQLPEGVVWAGTTIGAFLVVCSPVGTGSNLVAVADLTGPDFVRRGGRRRSLLPIKLDHLLCSETSDKDRAWVPIKDIEAQDFVLMLSRYRPNTMSGPALEAIKTFGGQMLGDVAEIIRPLAIPKDDDGDHVVFEAGVRDIDQAGFVGRPHATHRIASAGRKVADRQRIRAGDVLLSVKGSVIGQVALVADNPPPTELWTASQSFVILRPKRGMRSTVLAAFFQDAGVQAMLSGLAQGVSLKTLGAAVLRSIQIPLVDEATADKVDDRIKQRREINSKIAELSQQLIETSAWP